MMHETMLGARGTVLAHGYRARMQGSALENRGVMGWHSAVETEGAPPVLYFILPGTELLRARVREVHSATLARARLGQ
jgi:hypothetical protein